MGLITPLLAWALLGSAVGAAAEPAGRHVVYLSQNNYPSLLYINSAHGTASMDHRADTSDIIQLILHPSNPEAKQTRRAAVVLTGEAQGTLTLTQSNPPVGPTVIEGVISNLSPGLHGFHIHQLGDLTGGCASAGGHYNPYMRPHGSPEDRERHVGDLGNILADATGRAEVNITDPLVTLVGPRTVLGRAVVVHAGEDDLGDGGNDESLKTGNAGGRVACGVIGHA